MITGTFQKSGKNFNCIVAICNFWTFNSAWINAFIKIVAGIEQSEYKSASTFNVCDIFEQIFYFLLHGS